MKHLLLTLLATAALAGAAQQVVVQEHRRLLQGVEGPAYYPALDASGTRLLFTDADACGLKLYDFNDDVTTRITALPGAGMDAFFGGDGKVYYVTQELREHNLVYRTGHAYDVARHTDAVVLDAQHGAVHPVKAMRGAALKGENRSFRAPATMGLTVYTEGSTVVIGRDGRERAYTPVPSHAGYLWASLSPDATRVAFFAAERGICIIDLDGNLLAELGNYEMPAWLNEHYLVAQHATDDGHQFTSSQILLLKDDGSWTHALTQPSSMTMQPTAARGRVVYTTIDGNLFEMTLQIVEP
ncbi:MAG: hypothetical protein IJT30_07760 [Muribaculaceae bacterium]|nr:hypothetical protein [Muribaculaceae bacterium]